MYTRFFLFLDLFIVRMKRQILLKLSAISMLLATACLLFACGNDPDYERDSALYPRNGLFFEMFPNDKARNDSVSANLSEGVILTVHPRASYELSFDAEGGTPPTMQIFRLFLNSDSSGFNANMVQKVSGKNINGRFVYSFKCNENEMSYWAVTLEQDGTYYQGATRNVRLTGSGAYSDHMSLNLIVVGNVASELEGFTIDDLAQGLLQKYRKEYSSVTIDTLYVSYANEHPTLGYKYPANEPWIAGRSSEDVMLSELGGWPGRENALDLVLVHYIEDIGILGYSDLFAGKMGGGFGSTIVLGAFVHTFMGESALIMDNITETALHETGHFFGLRHSTASAVDLALYGDYSNYEDGFEDTPYCSNLLKRDALKAGSSAVTDFRVRRGIFHRVTTAAAGIANFNPTLCPDASNYMFPIDTEVEYNGFSEEQLAMLRASLMIYPH